MKNQLPFSFSLSREVAYAIAHNEPVVALESAVITHGLPYPQNLELALDMESIVRLKGAIPATVALIDGKIHIGLSKEQVESLSENKDVIKLSTRNIGIGIAQKRSGGTTVAATLFAAQTAGIRVFATGGIGGVHRNTTFDISADLDELAKSQVVVICAGAKSILDLPNTLEALETRGVPVLGYQTDTFPAFYSRSSGLPVDASVNSAAEIAAIAKAHWEAERNSAILVAQPPSDEFALDHSQIESVIEKAVIEADKNHIHGAKVTPFLLEKVAKLSGGKSLEANLSLLKNNATLAAEVAVEISRTPKKFI